MHVHPRDTAGLQTVSPGPCGEAVAAIRVAAPNLEISVSTGAFIDSDVERRVSCILDWTVPPDVVSVNLFEEGAGELCQAAWSRGISVEAGLTTEADARSLASLGLARYCRRLLVEIEAPDPADAVAEAQAVDALLDELLVPLPRLWHGTERATWAVIAAGARAGRGVRIGLEDTLELPDGRAAPGNEAMVRAVNEIQRRAAAAR